MTKVLKQLIPSTLILSIVTGCFHSDSSPILFMETGKKHHLKDGTFVNNYIGSIDKPFMDLLKWNWNRKSPEPFSFTLAENDPDFLNSNRITPTLTWIGHSTLLLQYAGLNILTDPHLTDRASPLSFAGPKRYTPPGLSLEDLPLIDLVLISHNHYDHLDRQTIVNLYNRQLSYPLRFYVPLKQKQWFTDLGISNVVELDWGESDGFRDWQIHAVPVQHWSSRSLWDRNEVLWSGWVLEHSDFRFFFAGDTGYSQDFKDLGRRFGNFDLAAIPIGGYEPRWFMEESHINPEESVKIHRDIHANYSVGIHWGTFLLSDEEINEPLILLRKALKNSGIPLGQFFIMQHGETRKLNFLRKNNSLDKR